MPRRHDPRYYRPDNYGAYGAYGAEPRLASGFDPSAAITDTDPVPPWIRGQSGASAVADVARVARKAAEEHPGAKAVARKWTKRALNPVRWGPELLSEKVPWAPGMKLYRWITKKAGPGKVVLWEGRDRQIIERMIGVYQEGAADLAAAGAGDWAEVLSSTIEGLGGQIERLEEISLESGVEETVKRGRGFLKIAGPVALIGALAYLVVLKPWK